MFWPPLFCGLRAIHGILPHSPGVCNHHLHGFLTFRPGSVRDLWLFTTFMAFWHLDLGLFVTYGCSCRFCRKTCSITSYTCMLTMEEIKSTWATFLHQLWYPCWSIIMSNAPPVFIHFFSSLRVASCQHRSLAQTRVFSNVYGCMRYAYCAW